MSEFKDVTITKKANVYFSMLNGFGDTTNGIRTNA